MNKLICVEYLHPTGGEEVESPLIGCIGETLEKYLHPRSALTEIPVRFPLVGPGSRTFILRGDRDPTDPWHLSVEGVSIKKNRLIVLPKVTPVSMYARVPTPKEVHKVKNKQYFTLYSLKNTLRLVESLGRTMPNSWIWRKDVPMPTMDNKHIFLEARVYNINTVVGAHLGNKVNGVAIEISFKPQPSKEEWAAGIRVLRTRTNLYLFSDSGDHIEYIDGTRVSREAVTCARITDNLNRFVSAKKVTSLKRFKGLSVNKEKQLRDVPPNKDAKKNSKKYTMSNAEKTKGQV